MCLYDLYLYICMHGDREICQHALYLFSGSIPSLENEIAVVMEHPEFPVCYSGALPWNGFYLDMVKLAAICARLNESNAVT